MHYIERLPMVKTHNKIFEAMNSLAEIRHIYAREEPKLTLTPGKKERIKKHLSDAKKAIAFLEKRFREKE